jgi:hypothetical protein
MSDEPRKDAGPDGARPASAGPAAAWTIAVVFAILFAGPLFWAVSDLIGYPAAVGGRTPWWLLIAAVVLPVVLYVGGLLAGRRRTPVMRTVVLGAALCAANAVTIGGIALAPFLL